MTMPQPLQLKIQANPTARILQAESFFFCSFFSSVMLGFTPGFTSNNEKNYRRPAGGKMYEGLEAD